MPRAVWEGVEGRTARDIAQQVGLAGVGSPLESPIQYEEYRRVIRDMFKENADVLVVGESAENFANRLVIIELAEEHQLPTLYPDRSFVESGGLFGYGVDYLELYRRIAGVIDDILKGAKPGDIPFYQASKYRLIINLKTAKVLGLTVAPTLLARADEVIE